MEEASYLMDRPVGGWSELVTNHTLDLKFADLGWRIITAVIAGMAVMAAIFAGVTAGLFAILGT